MQLLLVLAELNQQVTVVVMPTTLDDWRAEQIELRMKERGFTNVSLAKAVSARYEKGMGREGIGTYLRRETQQMATDALMVIESILDLNLLLTMESLEVYFITVFSTSNRMGDVVDIPPQTVPLIDPRGLRLFLDADDFYSSSDYTGAPMITILSTEPGGWAYLVPEGHPEFEAGKKIAINRSVEPNPGQYGAVLHLGRLELLECLMFKGERGFRLPDGQMTSNVVVLGTAAWLSLL